MQDSICIDLNFAVGWNRFNLSLLGIWPDPLQQPKQKGGLSRCRFMTASFFLLSFVCIPQSANLIFIWGNADMMTENLATANIPATNAFMKAFTIWRQRKALKSLVSFLYQDWYMPKTSEERIVMLKSATFVRKISIWCTILTLIMATIFIVLRISMIFRFSNGDPGRPLLYTSYFPFDVTYSPIFELIWVCQIISAYSASIFYTSSVSFISMLVFHVCGQFQNLRAKLKNLANEVKTSEEFKNKLKQIIKRHEHLSWFAKTMEDSFNMILLIQILSCTIQLCFQGFQIFRILINKHDDGSPIFQLIFLITYVGFILIHLYIYCFIGEMLLVQNTEMGFSAYESNWYNVSGKEARNLLFIMHRSVTPLCLTAGKFSTFSLQMFSKADLEYAYGWNRYTMTFIGIWPEHRSFKQASSYKAIIPVSLMIYFICGAQTLNLPNVWGNFDLVVENLTMGNATISISLWKTISFWLNALKKLISHMENDWNMIVDKQQRKTMQKIAIVTRKLSIISTVVCQMVVITYTFYALFVILHSTNETERPPFFRAYFPYNVTISPAYEITFLGQLVAGTYAATIYTAVDTFIAMLVLHTCGQFKILRRELKNLCNYTKTEFQTKLGNIVRKHEYLNRFAETIEDSFNKMLLMEMVGCSMQLCFQFLQALMAIMNEVIDEVTLIKIGFLVVYVVYTLMQLYLYCYIGEELLVESTKMVYAAYDCSWYNLSAREARLLMIIMCRARSPLQITAGGFCSFNRELFSEVLRKSVAFMSCFYAVNSLE